MIKNIFLCFVAMFAWGCQQYSPDFIQVVQDHRSVTVETTDSVIKSIDDEMSNPLLTEEDKIALSNLRKRLVYMKESSKAIERYILNEGDEDLIRQLLRGSWGS